MKLLQKVVVTFFLIILIIYGLFGTSSGTYVVTKIVCLLNGKIEIGKVSGTFFHGLKLTDIKYHQDKYTFFIQRIIFTAIKVHKNSLAMNDIQISGITYSDASKNLKGMIINNMFVNILLNLQGYSFILHDLQGKLHEKNIHGGGQYIKANNEPVIFCDFTVGNNHILIDEHNAQLEANINIDKLEELFPNVRGIVVGNIKINKKQWDIKVKLQNVFWEQQSLEQLNIDLHTGLAYDKPLELNIQGKGNINKDPYSIKAFTRGVVSKHIVNVNISGQKHGVSAIFSGGLHNINSTKKINWQGRLTSCLGTWFTDVWQIQQDSDIFISCNKIVLKKIQAKKNKGTEKVLVDFDSYKNWWKLHINCDKVNLSPIGRAIDKTVNLQGVVNGFVDIEQKNNKNLIVQSVINVPKIIFNMSSSMQAMEFHDFVYKANTEDRKVINELHFGSGENNFTANFSVLLNDGLVNIAQGSIEGEIDYSGCDLTKIKELIPDIARLKAEFQSKINIRGTLQKPKFLVQAALNNGTLTFYDYGIKVKPFNIEVNSKDNDLIAIQGKGSMRWGEGIIYVQGVVEPNNNWYNILYVSGEDIEFINTEAYHLFASPDLTLSLSSLTQLNISGNVKISRGTINLHKQTKKIVLSDDVGFTGNLAHTMKNAFTVVPDLYLRIEDVHLQSNDISTNITGKLRLTEVRDRWSADGRVSLKGGTYKIPGKLLYINRSRLVYHSGSPLSNPYLDINLSNTPEKDTEAEHEDKPASRAGIYIQGTLSDPDVRDLGMFSDKTAVAHALNFGGGKIIQDIQERLGLEELGLEATDSMERTPKHIQVAHDPSVLDDNQFVLGKKLTQKIRVQYLKSLVDTQNTLKLKYELNDNWFMSMDTGNEGSGVDVGFSYE